jgi:hypothetical protein
METQYIPHPDRPAFYRLRLQGRVNAEWSDWLNEIEVTYGESQPAITTITGEVRDQAALFGLLSFVRDLGVPLIAVELVQPR